MKRTHEETTAAAAHDKKEEIVLFSYFRSSCSWRVRIALNLKQIPYTLQPVNLLKGEQKSPENLQRNPMALVPSLIIDGHTLSQSLAILEYLEETRKGSSLPLLPSDPHSRAVVRAIASIIIADVQPLHNLRTINKVSDDKAKQKEWVQHWVVAGTVAVEKILESSAGKYCVGDDITIADICLVPHIYTARRWGVDLTPFPICVRIDALLAQHPSFIAAAPKNQPDVPPELKDSV